MRRALHIIILLLSAVCTMSGQTQKGFVKTRGILAPDGKVKAGTPISSVSIKVIGHNNVISDRLGTFSFPMSEKQFCLQSVVKGGYVLSDPDALKRTYPYTAQDPLVIVMEKKTERDSLIEIAKERMSQTLNAQLSKKETEIVRLKKENKIKEEEYDRLKLELYEHKSRTETVIAELVRRYISIDYDRLDSFNIQVNYFIQNGDLLRADSLIRTRGTIEERLNNIKKLEDAREQLAKALQKEKEALAEDLISKFTIYYQQFKNDSAAYCLLKRNDVDTLNLSWQIEAGLFLMKNLQDEKRALAVYQRALQRGLKMYGDNDNADIATCYCNIGVILMNSEFSEEEQALSFFQKALDMLKRIYGEHHPDVAACYNNIGTVYSHIEDHYTANLYYDMARNLEIDEEYQKEEEDNLFSVVNAGGGAEMLTNQGLLLAEQGDYEGALSYYGRALDWILYNIDTKGIDFNHPLVATIYLNMGDAYTGLGEYESARHYLDESWKIRRNILGADSIGNEAVYYYNGLGCLFLNQKDYVNAIKAYSRSVSIIDSIGWNNNKRKSLAYSNLGNSYYLSGDMGKAIPYLLKSIEIEQSVTFGANYNTIANQYKLIRDYYTETGHEAEGKEYSAKATAALLQGLQLKKQRYGDTHVVVGIEYANIGLYYYNDKNYVTAKDYFLHAVEMFDKLGYDNLRDTYSLWHLINNTYKNLLTTDGKYQKEYKQFKDRIIAIAYINDNAESDNYVTKTLQEADIYLPSFHVPIIQWGNWKYGQDPFLIEDEEVDGISNGNLVTWQDGSIQQHDNDKIFSLYFNYRFSTKKEQSEIKKTYTNWLKK